MRRRRSASRCRGRRTRRPPRPRCRRGIGGPSRPSSCVHAADGQQRRDGNAPAHPTPRSEMTTSCAPRRAAARAWRPRRARANASPRWPRDERPRRVEHDDRRHGLPELRQLGRAQDRGRDRDGGGETGGVEQVGAAPDWHLERHHRALPLRVDRRVRDLREGLAQECRDAARPLGERRDRRVVPHAPDRLVPFEGHGPDGLAHDLRVEPERDAPAGVRRRDLGRQHGRHPRSREAPRTMALDRRSPDLPRSVSTTTSSPGPSAFAPRHPRVGSSSTLPASDATTSRPSSVAVMARGRRPFRSSSAPTRCPSANTIAAGPSHGSLATASGPDPAVPQPYGRGNEDCRSPRRPRHPPSRSSSTASSRDCESDPDSVTSGPTSASRFAQRRRAELVTTAAHRLAVRPDRVDLAVVREVAERLRQPPRRERVRGVALVEQRVSGVEVRGAEVRVEPPELVADEEALVDDRATG